MPFITFCRKFAPFSRLFAALAICFAFASVAAVAQNAAKIEFHDLEENSLSQIDPLVNLRRNDPKRFEDFSKSSAANLKTPVENLAPTAGELDAPFVPSIDLIAGTVRASAVQTDGKIVAAGYFKTVNASRRDNIVRFNADNSIDETFAASTNGTIYALAIQPDGKIVIAGVFTAVNGISRNTLARLNADGSLDSGFDAGTGAEKTIFDLAIQADGKIFIGGAFLGVNGHFSPNVARLNANGSVDTTFASRIPPATPNGIASIVYSLALQPDGRVAVGGFIADQFGQTFKAIYRFNPDGTYDASFNSGSISSNLYEVVIQPDGKFIIGGFFTTINGVSRRYIARLNSDGSLDASFDAGTNSSSPVNAVYLKPDGKILFGGISAANGLVKQLNPNGTLDVTFSTNEISSRVNTISLTGGGKIFVGSSAIDAVNFVSNAAFLFNGDGSQDSTFRFVPTAESLVAAIAVQPDGKILIGGTFNKVNGASRSGLARLNADGTLDTTFVLCNGCSVFSSSTGYQISDIVIQPDGKIIVGGSNITTGSTGFAPLVRLNQNGSIDGSFSLPEDLRSKAATTVALRSDGKIFFAYAGYNALREYVGGISRINADGSIDSSFTSDLTPVIESVAPLPDGKVLAGGAFSFGFINTPTGSEFFYGLIRLNENGTLDRSFRAGFVSNDSVFTSVYSVALQSDGQILVGGRLFTGNSTAPSGVARLNPATGTLDETFQRISVASTNEFARVEKIKLLSNGKIVAGGRFNNFGGVANANVARLNPNGTLDAAFQASANKTVFEIAPQADGKVLIGGQFDSVNNVPRTYLARLLNEPVAPRRTKFDFDGDGKADLSVFRPSNAVWYLNNSTAGFSAVQWGISNDVLAPADYDGDGKTDPAVYRGGVWYLLRSQTGFASVQFGSSGDIPQPFDFDGDGRAELAVYRPSNGVWYSLNLANNQVGIVQFGLSEDKPVIGDFDGDGKADLAVFRPSNSVWYILQSRDGFKAVQWGNSTDKIVPADYDGDGKTDIAIYRDGVWYILKSNGTGNLIAQFGIASDVPAPADYDGDDKADIAVYRDGVWYLRQTTNGIAINQFGLANDKPIANSFVK